MSISLRLLYNAFSLQKSSKGFASTAHGRPNTRTEHRLFACSQQGKRKLLFGKHENPTYLFLTSIARLNILQLQFRRPSKLRQTGRQHPSPCHSGFPALKKGKYLDVSRAEEKNPIPLASLFIGSSVPVFFCFPMLLYLELTSLHYRLAVRLTFVVRECRCADGDHQRAERGHHADEVRLRGLRLPARERG